MSDLQKRAAEAVAAIAAVETWINTGDGEKPRYYSLAEAAALITELAGQVPAWRPISEAPKDGAHFWAFQPRGRDDHWFECWWHDGNSSPYHRDGWMDFGDTEPAPTHFMLRPAAPTPEGEAG